MTDYVGTSGDDSIAGTDLADTFDLSQGGDDTADGGAGNDVFNMGGAFNAADRLIGGPGNDVVVLDGDYSASVFYSLDRFSTIERVAFEAGHDYRMNLIGTTPGFAIELQYHIGADDRLVLDGRRIEGGVGILFEGGDGHETILGSGGFDTVYMHGGLTADDRINGGGGHDVINLSGDYSGGLVMNNKTLQGIEDIALDPGHSYDLTFAKTTVGAAGMSIEAANSTHANTLRVNASKAYLGNVSIDAGGGNDVLIGGALDDRIWAGKGRDQITGGSGADVLHGQLGADRFIYLHATDSTIAAHDLISDLGSDDIIDLKKIDADVGASGNQAFHLVEAFDGHAAELTLSYDAGSGLTTIQGDIDGDGAADLVISAMGDQSSFTSFVL